MDPSQRSLSTQQRGIQTFVFQAVSYVLDRLEGDSTQSSNATEDTSILQEKLRLLLLPLEEKFPISAAVISEAFGAKSLQNILEACEADYARYPIQDPALSNMEEVLYASNGFWATVAYRLANALKQLGVPIIPRTISGIAHSRTGVDIHPGATIAPGLFIDHGTGIAIGCTAVLGENVNIYNGVVLGTRSKPSRKQHADSKAVVKRHPTIGNGVSLFTNAFVCEDVPAGEVRTGQNSPAQGSRAAIAPRPSCQAAPAAKRVQQNAATPARSPGVISMVGNTPMVEINGMHENTDVRIFAKLEGANPSGSVKDRIALKLIEQGEADGSLTPNKIILESTSGNTGIGLAMIGAAKGYKVVLTMSSAMSEERKKVLRAFGATLIETDPTKGTGGAIAVARQMAAENPGVYWMARQHSSLNNPLAHYEHTGLEILQQVPELTHFVAGIGTFGTLRGAGVRLREEIGAEVVGIEPVLGQSIQGLRNMQEPNSPELYDESLLDQKLMAMADPAYEYTRKLARQSGLFLGMSSGAAMDGAVRLADSIDRGTIVVLFPDRGEKYLSTTLFADTTPNRASVTEELDYAI